MATLNDLRLRSGVWTDTNSWDTLTGTASDDVITIYGGNDYVDAGLGNDVIYDFHSYAGGSSGQDIIRGGSGNDTIFTSLDTSSNLYDGGAGIDTVNFVAVGSGGAGVDVDLFWGTAVNLLDQTNSTLLSIENVVGTAFNDFIDGNAVSNNIRGYDGSDRIDGRDGSDRLAGENGHDVLIGGSGNDVIDGGGGNDILVGGLGSDIMAGGQGTDTFAYAAFNESGNGSLADKILGFQHLVDRINVLDLDANTLIGGNQAFRFIGGRAFDAAGQIRFVFDAARDQTLVLFNSDNDATAEMTIKLDGHVVPSSADFVL